MKKYSLLIAIMAAFSFTIGCAGPSRVEMDYGTSHQLQKFNQICNPEAEKNLTPVTGMTGKAAQYVAEKHEKGFEKEKKTVTNYQFNIGSM